MVDEEGNHLEADENSNYEPIEPPPTLQPEPVGEEEEQ